MSKPKKIIDMKAKFFVCILLIVVGCIFYNCKGGLDEPTPPVKKVTITAEAGLGGKIIGPTSIEVAIGENVKILTEADPGFKQKVISINGVLFPLISSDYLIPKVSENIKAKAEFEITPWGMLMSGLWKQSGYMSKNKGETKWNILTPRKVTYTFGSDNKFQSNDNGFSSDGVYKLTTDSLFIGTNPTGNGGFRYIVSKLSKDTLEIKSEIKYIGNDNLPNTEIIEKYIHLR